MQYRGVAQFGRAPRSGRGGRKFKSCHLDQENPAVFGRIFLCKKMHQSGLSSD